MYKVRFFFKYELTRDVYPPIPLSFFLPSIHLLSFIPLPICLVQCTVLTTDSSPTGTQAQFCSAAADLVRRQCDSV